MRVLMFMAISSLAFYRMQWISCPVLDAKVNNLGLFMSVSEDFTPRFYFQNGFQISNETVSARHVHKIPGNCILKYALFVQMCK